MFKYYISRSMLCYLVHSLPQWYKSGPEAWHWIACPSDDHVLLSQAGHWAMDSIQARLLFLHHRNLSDIRWLLYKTRCCSGVYGGVRHKHCGKSYNKNNHLTDYLLLTGYVVIILCFWINLSSISWGTKIYTGGVGGLSSARTRKLGLSSINNIRLCLIIIP